MDDRVMGICIYTGPVSGVVILMEDKEMIDKLAELMGWESRKRWPDSHFIEKNNSDYWWDGEIPKYGVKTWQPPTDWNHLMQVVEKTLSKPNQEFELRYFDGGWEAYCNPLDRAENRSIWSAHQDPKHAIAEALIKTMEE